LGVHADWTTQSFDSLLIGLNQDRYDMVVASHAVTPERSRAVDFIHPHYCSGGVILAKKGGPQTLHDLTGKTVAAQVSSIYPKFLEKTGGISSIKELPKDTDCIQALLTGRVDAVVTDRFVAVTALKANPGAGLQFGKFINPEHNAMAVARGNTSLKKAVDQALAELMKDGTYARLSQQYFGEDIRCK
jgi:polar amino acid transport system substrate-binding protein